MELRDWQKTLISGSVIAALGWLSLDYLSLRDHVAADTEFRSRVIEFMAAGDRNTFAMGERRDREHGIFAEDISEIQERIARLEERLTNHIQYYDHNRLRKEARWGMDAHLPGFSCYSCSLPAVEVAALMP